MTTKQFRQLYKYVNAIYSGDYIVFKVSKHRWELYHIPTEETQIYKTFDELAKNEVVAKIIETYVERGLKLDMPKGSREGQRDTNEGVDRWLRRNAKKYGFKYEFKKA